MSDCAQENIGVQDESQSCTNKISVSIDIYEDEGDSNIAKLGPYELHEKFQEFVKTNGSRNTSQDFDTDDTGNTDQSFGSENAGNSYAEKDVDDLVQYNKSFRQRNDELQLKNDQLLRQLEIAEDESEQQRKQISTLEKELKCIHDMLRDRDSLESENENLHVELHSAQEDKLKLENCVKRHKIDQADFIATINSQQEQIDSLSNDVRSLSLTNKSLFDESTSLKDRCVCLKMDLEVKDKELEEKMQLYQEVREQAENFKRSNQNLLDEKEALLLQLRDIQLEVSYYQAGHKVLDDVHLSTLSSSSRHLFSLQSEIAEAEQGARRKSFHCSSPVNFSESVGDESFSNNSRLMLSDVTTPTDQILQNSCSQTDTESVNLGEPATPVSRKDQFIVLEEKLQSKDKLVAELNEVLSQHKSKEQYLARQLGMNLNKTKELLLLNQKHAGDIIHLTDINSKLCASKLNVWFDENKKVCSVLSGGDSDKEDTAGSDWTCDFDASTPRLVDALALENYQASTARKHTRSVSFFFGQRSVKVETFMSKVNNVLTHDLSTVDARLFVLKKCAAVIEEAVSKKIELIRELIKDALQWQLFNTCEEKQLAQPSLTIAHEIKGHLHSAHALMHRLEKLAKSIGALEMEKRFNFLLEMLINHVNDLKEQRQELQKNLNFHSKRNDRFWFEEQKIFSFNANVSEDSSVVEITPGLLQSVTARQPRWMRKLSGAKHVGGLFEAFFGLSYKLHTSLPSLSRTSFLLLTLLLCCYISVSWVDYKVDPVF